MNRAEREERRWFDHYDHGQRKRKWDDPLASPLCLEVTHQRYFRALYRTFLCRGPSDLVGHRHQYNMHMPQSLEAESSSSSLHHNIMSICPRSASWPPHSPFHRFYSFMSPTCHRFFAVGGHRHTPGRHHPMALRKTLLARTESKDSDHHLVAGFSL